MIIPAANRLNGVQEYYFSRKLKEVRTLASQGKEIINLGIGSPDLPPSAQTISRLREAAPLPENHGYQPYRGIAPLRQAISEWYQQTYHVTAGPDNEVLPLIGSKEGIFHISMAFLNPGDQVLVPDPGYPGYAGAAEICGAQPRRYPLTAAGGWMPDLAQLANEDLSRVKLMWINYPHMPTGQVATIDQLQAIVDFTAQKGILLCHDNPYSTILNNSAPLSVMRCRNAFSHCLELNSLSKSHHMAGWRVGILIGKQSYLEHVLTVKSNIDSGTFLPVQLAAIEALKNSPEWHLQQDRIYRQRRKAIQTLLDTIGFSYSEDGAGLFVWARAPEHISDLEAYLDQMLYEAGVFITPGKVFGSNGERYIRISLCGSLDKINRATQKLAVFQNQLSEARFHSQTTLK